MNHSVTTPPLPGQHSLTGWIFVGFLSSVLLVVGLLRFQGMTALPDDAPVSWQRALRFEDRPNGDIAVCTVHGDVWIVRREGEKKLRWHRFATGLHQPLGLVIVRGSSKATPHSPLPTSPDSLHVLCRDQIVRLHDLNNDLEADFYECFSNVYPTSAGGHDYITCLERDSQGNFWFVHANLGIVRVSSDGSKFEVISTGLRNPNGMGLGPGDVVTAAPQEGEWTPASAIYVAKLGAHFGGGGPRTGRSGAR